MARVYPQGGHIIFENDDGHLIWSSELRPVNLLPDEYAITLTDYEIEFPDFAKRWWYGHNSWSGPFSAEDGCTSIMSLRPGDYPLPDINLGPVPTGVNYVDVRVNLTRTVNPANIGDISAPPELAPGQWVHLPGASCMVEAFASYARMFWFEIVSGNLVLKRKQTANRVPGLLAPPQPTWQAGGGDSASVSGPYCLMQSKVGTWTSGSPPRALGGSDACRIDVNHPDFSTRSVYKGAITIRPGLIDCVGDGCAVNGGRTLQVTRQPVSGWNYQITPGNNYVWQGTNITWANQVVEQFREPTSLTEILAADGWIYERGPHVTGSQYRVARRRETVIA